MPLLVCTNQRIMARRNLYQGLDDYCATLPSEFEAIPASRRSQLEELGEYIRLKIVLGEPVRLIVICTHNSRRSHMGQLWLQAAAAYYGVEDVALYSGGTEVTAFNHRAVNALREAGFRIDRLSQGDNPRYLAASGPEVSTLEMYSKYFDDRENPKTGFAAVIVCSAAETACPVVPGAEARFAIPFLDPKVSDGSDLESQVYAERTRQIGREMFYTLSYVIEMIDPNSGAER